MRGERVIDQYLKEVEERAENGLPRTFEAHAKHDICKLTKMLRKCLDYIHDDLTHKRQEEVYAELNEMAGER